MDEKITNEQLQRHVQQHLPTGNSSLIELIDDRQLLTLANGQRITLAEYNAIREQQRPIPMSKRYTTESDGDCQRVEVDSLKSKQMQSQTQQSSNEKQRPIQLVAPTMQKMVRHDANVRGRPTEWDESKMAKMLIFLQNGEQRLITFAMPRERCTLHEILQKYNVPFSENTYIQCIHYICSEIDYFVSVGSSTRIEEIHPLLVGDLSSRRSPKLMPQPQSSEMSTPEISQCPENSKLFNFALNRKL